MMPRHWICASDRLSITWDDGPPSEYHAIWLADNNPAHRDRCNRQRLIDVTELPSAPLIAAGELRNDYLRLVWTNQTITEFSLEWLFVHRPDGARYERTEVRKWDGSDSDILQRDSFDRIRNSPSLRLKWLKKIASIGVAFLSGVPPEDSKVLEIAALVGWVRDTNYGRVFDVRAISKPNNLAYTELALGLHTDNPYRDPVPGLQILHCLKGSQKGGASLLVDGFRAADVLKTRRPAAFEMLASTPVRFEFSDINTYLSAERPIIQQNNREIEAIHYNSRAMAPLQIPATNIPEFYDAYRAFATVLREHAQVLVTSLNVGDVVVFDNRRILHGRTAFSSDDPRHLQGCYLDQDGLHSQIAVLERSEQH